MFENQRRTELHDLGEFGLIEHITSYFKNQNKESVFGIGDDAAVLDFGEKYTLVSTDHFIEGIHFDLTFHPLRHLGYKAVAAAVSDICAMNGNPLQILVNIGLSNRFSLEAVEEIYSGIQIACEKYAVDLIGGDTSSSPRGLYLSVTAIGCVDKDKVTYRKGAEANDLLVLTGDIGGAYMGLQILEREKKVFMEHPEMQPDLERHDYIVGRQLRPDARKDVIQILAEKEILPTSMIDVSDGVASEIHHLGKQSGVGFQVFENKLPIDPQTVERAIEFGLNPSIAALNGGEDYELLFTIKQGDYEKIKHHPDMTVIGHATELVGKYNLITESGNSFEIQAQGWQHFQG
ncbi:MAG: thiamine-phosphate kinase [Bacteroidetes bacterium]|nr:thiamine-phosphate kinase [Bacteroidota bacterium]